jgi:hypothetical protein
MEMWATLALLKAALQEDHQPADGKRGSGGKGKSAAR